MTNVAREGCQSILLLADTLLLPTAVATEGLPGGRPYCESLCVCAAFLSHLPPLTFVSPGFLKILYGVGEI